MENIEVFVRTKAAQLAAQQYQNNFRPVVTKQAGVQEVMASIVERLKALPPEQQRLLMGAGGVAAVGGLSGAVGAIRNRGANRSVIGDSLRGALAGGAVGGGGALAYNAAIGGRTGLGGLVAPAKERITGKAPAAASPDFVGAVDALDRARQDPNTMRSGIVNTLYDNDKLLIGGGAGIGLTSDLHNRFGTGPKGERFMGNLRQMIDNLPDGDKKLQLNNLHSALTSNPGQVPKVMQITDRFSTNTGSFADRLTKTRLGMRNLWKGRRGANDAPKGVRTDSTGPDKAFKHIDRMLNPTKFQDVVDDVVPKVKPSKKPFDLHGDYLRPGGRKLPNQPERPTASKGDGKYTADDLRHARKGTGAAKAKPVASKGVTATATSALSKMPGRRALTGGLVGAGTAYLPALINSFVPGNGVPDVQAGQIWRDFGAID